jgi:hypothetical protein
MSEADNDHLKPLIQALVAAGNQVAWQGEDAGPFRMNPSGPYCQLSDPIDFAVARAASDNPEVVFFEELDFISCGHCWTTIYGGNHKALRQQRQPPKRVSTATADRVGLLARIWRRP